MGIVTTSSETAFTQPPEMIYDFVTNPTNWTRAYPGSPRISNVPELPLKVGDTWDESHPEKDVTFTWQLAVAMRPRLWTFTRPGENMTLFTRTMTIEAHKDVPMPDGFFRIVNPARIDEYHAAIAQHLESLPVS